MCPPFNVPNAITLTICIALEMFSTVDDRRRERRRERGEKGAEKEERRKKGRGEEKEER